VIAGVDTHRHTHHAAVLDAGSGKLLADQEFQATAAGYRQLLAWLLSFGAVAKVGIEGTGSYGAGLLRHLTAHGVTVIEVARPERAARRAQGKSDPLDAIAAARAVLAGTATAVPKDRDGVVETIRLLHTTRASAVKARRVCLQQMHAILAGGPEDLRRQLAGLNRAALIRRCARLRADRSRIADPAVAARAMLTTLAKRAQTLDVEIADLDAQIETLVEQTAPSVLTLSGVGPTATAQLLTTVGQNVHRITSEAALARLCGLAPIPASSGTHTRYRLHRGGDRAANSAIHLIVINRLRWDPRTRAYAQRRTNQGKNKKEIIRCLKRAIARELYRTLRTDLPDLTQPPIDHA
jgi:transposase